ncbi:MAG TPA: hypothetical protein VGG16_23535 [Streptosporangiaceae bacterium]
MPGPGWIGSTTVRKTTPGREQTSKPNAASVAVRWPGGMTLRSLAVLTGWQPAPVLTATSP